MFSIEDVREIVDSFPPAPGHHGLPPSLVLTSSGQSFITLEQLCIDFESRAADETKRVSVLQLAHDFDVTPGIIRTLVRKQRPLILLSNDETEVIPVQEVEANLEKLRESLRNGIKPLSEIKSEYGITYRHRLWDELGDVVRFDDHACFRAYDEAISHQALSVLKRVVDGITNIDLSAKDLEDLPGSPPKWRFLHHLKELADSPEYADKAFVRDTRDFIRVQSKGMRQRIFLEWTNPLVSGEIAYSDLQPLVTGHPIYDSISDAISDFKKLSNVEIIDTFVLSDAWFSNFVDQRVVNPGNGETSVIDVLPGLNEAFHSSGGGQQSFPDSMSHHIERKAEQHLINTLDGNSGVEYRRFGLIAFTETQYMHEQESLRRRFREHADAQWQQSKDDAAHEIKFSMTNVVDASSRIESSLSTDKKTQKACEEEFWSAISVHEGENEAAFATYWSDRVTSRIHVYVQGLTSISDPKLHEQLSELLATYIQKDLVPDSLIKARSQHLILSRKTRKNIDKLNSTLSTTDTHVPALVATLDKFTKKQSLPSSPDAAGYKQTMLQDMHRRMAKTSDAPVLYLSLVVVLLARHFDGIVYATGKFAPKLMKLLKEKIGAEEYDMLEKWKEGARKGSLTKGDKDGMRALAKGEEVEEVL